MTLKLSNAVDRLRHVVAKRHRQNQSDIGRVYIDDLADLIADWEWLNAQVERLKDEAK